MILECSADLNSLLFNHKKGVNQVNLTKEEFDILMFYNFGIAEWHEKSLILTEEEIIEILNCLKNSTSSPLVELVKHPFPKFIRKYFSSFPGAERFLKDPEFDYKVYLMTDTDITYLAKLIKSAPKERVAIDKVRKSSFSDLYSILRSSLADISKDPDTRDRGYIKFIKFLYLTQYIDFQEAKRLNLKIASQVEIDSLYSKEGLQGYQLEEKIACLNFPLNLVISRLLGLCGHHRESLGKIIKEFGMPPKYTRYLVDIILPSLMLSLAEFKHKIGFVEREYSPYDYREYTNKKISRLDLVCTIGFIKNNRLSPVEKQVISKFPPSKQITYIAQKFVFKDINRTSEALIIMPNQIQKVMRMVENKVQGKQNQQ